MTTRSQLKFAVFISLIPSFALANSHWLVEWARQQVQSGLVKPLAERENKSFSRKRPAPRERRVRVLRAELTRDKAGRNFVPFAVDVRFGSEWREDILGCVYEGSGDIFVKRGEAYRPAAFLLGQKAEPVPNVCQDAPESRA